MSKLSDTQRKILIAAAAAEGHTIAIPSNIRGGAAKKLADGLVAAGYAKAGSNRLAATAAGLRAAGAAPKAKRASKAGAARSARKPRAGTKQEQVIALLRQPDGATLAEVCKVTDWQPHTARAFISATLGKRLGLSIKSEKLERGRVYKVAE